MWKATHASEIQKWMATTQKRTTMQMGWCIQNPGNRILRIWRLAGNGWNGEPLAGASQLLTLSSMLRQVMAVYCKTTWQKVAYADPTSYILLKMTQQKINMPSGSGGLMRYFDEYRSKIRIKPGHIIILCVLVVLIMIILYTYGNRFLGIAG